MGEVEARVSFTVGCEGVKEGKKRMYVASTDRVNSTKGKASKSNQLKVL